MMITNKLCLLIMITLPALIISGSDPAECPSICPLYCLPICAVMGNTAKTFCNTCEIGVQNRCHGANWVVVSNCTCNFEGLIKRPVLGPGPVIID